MINVHIYNNLTFSTFIVQNKYNAHRTKDRSIHIHIKWPLKLGLEVMKRYKLHRIPSYSQTANQIKLVNPSASNTIKCSLQDKMGLPSLPTISGTVIVYEIVEHSSSRWPVQWLPSLTAPKHMFNSLNKIL